MPFVLLDREGLLRLVLAELWLPEYEPRPYGLQRLRIDGAPIRSPFGPSVANCETVALRHSFHWIIDRKPLRVCRELYKISINRSNARLNPGLSVPSSRSGKYHKEAPPCSELGYVSRSG